LPQDLPQSQGELAGELVAELVLLAGPMRQGEPLP
jgi:hypothetical protein